VLAAVGVVPLAVTAGMSLYALRSQQSAQAEQVGMELSRSVATAVDGELRAAVAILGTLATTPTLDRADLAGFRTRAERVLATRPDWAAIVLSAVDGTALVDTRVRDTTGLLPIFERDSFDQVLRTGAPSIGNVARSAGDQWFFPVRVPVLHNGKTTYVVSAIITPDTILSVLTRQRFPPDWVISIVDARGARVARSRAHLENVGGHLSETVQQVVDRGGAEGFGISYTLEGERIFTPYSRLPCGWIAVLGIPTSLVDAAAFRALSTYGGGILLSIALGILAALWIARSITRPIAGLRRAAESLGRRQTPVPPATSIQELRELSAALTGAASDLAQAEANLDELLRRERLARSAAEAADRAKDEFMAVLSHELRTPLNAVYGWAKMLQTGQLRDGEAADRATDAIVRNAGMQIQLIDDLLDLSRIASGKLRLEMRGVDLPQVLQAAVDAVRPAADAKGIRIHTVFHPDASLINGDPGRLQQVAWNLLTNAVKFTPKGGQVELHLRRLDSQVEVIVTDTGKGIEPGVLPHVFDRFTQADSSSTRTHGGLGLGLALVKHLVELHGGTVHAESGGEGRGATFTVRLPIAGEIRPAGVRGVSGPRDGEAQQHLVPLHGRRVAVVDDDRESLELTEAILSRAGAEVRTGASAASALRMVNEWRPDVLVSDIEMPGEDGYSLIRKVRALAPDEGGSTPAIALTAYGRTQDRMRCLAAGFNMHVPKPIDPGELTAIIAGLTESRRMAASGPASVATE
jgi:signal transduction histidine kinase/ActR/RegA family two-component response regulator